MLEFFDFSPLLLHEKRNFEKFKNILNFLEKPSFLEEFVSTETIFRLEYIVRL